MRAWWAGRGPSPALHSREVGTSSLIARCQIENQCEDRQAGPHLGCHCSCFTQLKCHLLLKVLRGFSRPTAWCWESEGPGFLPRCTHCHQLVTSARMPQSGVGEEI